MKALSANTVALCAMLIVGIMAAAVARHFVQVPYGPDSAAYVEQARSVLAGQGFQSRPFGLAQLGVERAPDRLFPPGYPVVIAAASWTFGLEPEIVAPWVSTLSLALLPLAIFLAFRSITGIPGAAGLGLLGAFAPGPVHFAEFALTDVFALLLAVASTGIVLAACDRGSVTRAFVAGLIGGFAYLTRNAHLALLLSTILMLIVSWAIAPRGERELIIKIAIAWAFGVTLCVLPWALRNLAVFGQMQPYEMAPSTIGVIANARSFLAAQVYDLSGSVGLGQALGWTRWGLLVLALVVLALVLLVRRCWPTLAIEQRRALLFATSYVFVGAAVVVVARSRYQWGETITYRHALQYTVFVLLASLVALKGLFGRRGNSGIAILALVLLVGRLAHIGTEHAFWAERPNQIAAYRTVVAAKAAQRAPCSRDATTWAISNYGWLYQVICDAPVRVIGMQGMGGRSIEQVAGVVRESVGKHAARLYLHPGAGLETPALPLGAPETAALNGIGWEVVANSPSELVLSAATR